MKSNLHPDWNNAAVITCACGNTFVTGSIHDTLAVDICSACHPFFTGEMKFVDTQGRVDKFIQKMQAAQARQATTGKKAKKKQVETDEQKSYKQLLQEQKLSLKKQPGTADSSRVA